MGLDVNWSLLGPPVDVGGAVMNGFQKGRALKKQMVQESAFAALAQNPNDPDALARLTATGPEGAQYAFGLQDRAVKQAALQRDEALRGSLRTAVRPDGTIDDAAVTRAYAGAGDLEGLSGWQTNQAKRQERTVEQQREMLKFGARLLEGVTPETYGERRAAFQRAGFDVTNVPEQYDPAFVSSVVQAGEALSAPEKESQYTLPPGGIRYDSSGNIVAQSPYAPTVSADGVVYERRPTGATAPVKAPPKPGDVVNGYRFRGGDLKDRSNWEPVAQGGQTPPASGNFP